MSLTKNQLRTLAGIATTVDGDKLLKEAVQVNESEKYDGSIDFTHDLETAEKHLKGFGDIIESSKFEEWAKTTDYNFGTSTHSKLEEIESKFEELEELMKAFVEELHSAG